MLNKISNKKTSAFLILLLLLIFAVACSSSGDSEPAAENENGTMEEMNHEDGDMEDMDHEEMDHEDGEMSHDDHDEMDHGDRIQNPDGAAIHITSPADGDTFKHGDQIIVEVEVENYVLGEEGSHWHVYVDGTSFGMVMGGNTDQPLTGVEPGEHEISVYLANGAHEEFEDGSSITLMVEE